MTRSFGIAGCLTALVFSTLPLLAIAQDIDLVDVTLVDGTGASAASRMSPSASAAARSLRSPIARRRRATASVESS